MCEIKKYKIGDEITFKHKFHREDEFTFITGEIKEINENGVDYFVHTIFGDFFYW